MSIVKAFKNAELFDVIEPHAEKIRKKPATPRVAKASPAKKKPTEPRVAKASPTKKKPTKPRATKKKTTGHPLVRLMAGGSITAQELKDLLQIFTAQELKDLLQS